MRLTIRAAALCTLAALGAGAAQAQPPAPDEHRGQRPMAAQMQARHEAHERQRVQDLRTILRLRPDQEPALAAFLSAMKPPMGSPERRGPPAGAEGPMSTPQRLDAMARRETEHAARGQRHAEAIRAFYAALSPEQRQVFDALQRMHGGGPGDHGPGGPEHGGWGHHGFGGGPGGGPPPRD